MMDPETSAFLKLLALSELDKQQGRVLSKGELIARIQKRKDALKPRL